MNNVKLTDQEWFCRADNRFLMEVLGENGKEARYIGGCVRDALCGRAVHDIDIATPELPDQVIALLEKHDIRAIPTGIDHGTITALINGQSFEITTLRNDVSTDGRRATVSFCDDWLEDAKRRDFTFNAISLDRFGNLYDPFDGQADLKAGRVRFIGAPEDRIREDYLRLLRFFRFNAFFGHGPVDGEALAACCMLAEGLNQLSGERIAQELLRLLSAPRAAKWVAMMIRSNILQKILPHVQNGPELEMLCAFEDHPDGLRRLACLLPADETVVRDCISRLRLSGRQAKRLLNARCSNPMLNPAKGVDSLRCFMYRFDAVAARDQLFLYWAEKGFSGIGPREQALLNEIAGWEENSIDFPVQGRDLMERGMDAGVELGKVLRELESWWCDNGCRADFDSLMAELEKRRS